MPGVVKGYTHPLPPDEVSKRHLFQNKREKGRREVTEVESKEGRGKCLPIRIINYFDANLGEHEQFQAFHDALIKVAPMRITLWYWLLKAAYLLSNIQRYRYLSLIKYVHFSLYSPSTPFTSPFSLPQIIMDIGKDPAEPCTLHSPFTQ